MLNSIFKPKVTEDLIRVGQNLDGGYIINKEILNKTEIILTFGLSDEFSFEKEFKKNNQKVNIFVYDHTVNFMFWLNHFVKWTLHFLKNRSNFRRIFYFLDYLFFF